MVPKPAGLAVPDQPVAANRVNRPPIRPSEMPGKEPKVNSQPPSPFSKVLQEELKLIATRRGGPEHVNRNADDLLSEQGLKPEPPSPTDRTDEDASQKRARLAALRGHVAGLSFSGGGIRSGTFAVGFIQGLASMGLLKRLDYLSTVSGGGYAGAWLAAWLKREGGDPTNVERQLTPSRVDQARANREFLNPDEVVDEEPQPLRHLRSYSSYMFPRPGLLSVDTWTVILIWARNVSINLLMILPLAMLLVVGGRLAVYASVLFDRVEYEPGFAFRWPGLLTFLGLVIGIVAMSIALRENARWLIRLRRPRPSPNPQADHGSPESAIEVMNRVRRGIMIPAAVASVFLTISLRPIIWAIGERIDTIEVSRDVQVGKTFQSVILDAFQSDLGVLGPTNLLLHFAVLAGLMGLGAATNACRSLKHGGPRFPGQLTAQQYQVAANSVRLAWVALSLIFIHLLLVFFGDKLGARLAPFKDFAPTFVLITLGVSCVSALAAYIALGVRGRKFIRAAAMAGGTGGVLLVLLEALIRSLAQAGRPDLIATFAPPLTMMIAVAALIVQVAALGRVIDEAEREWWARISARLTRTALFWIVGMATIIYLPAVFLGAGPIFRSLIATGWVATAAAGVLSGRFVTPKTQGDAALRLTQLASIAAQVFLVGMLGAVALVGSMLLNMPGLFDPRGDDLTRFAYYLEGVKGTSALSLILLAGGSSILVLVAGRLIDVNLFSLNAMYANRLTRCYLGASRPMSSWADRWGTHVRDTRTAAGAPSLTEEAAKVLPLRDANPITGFDSSNDDLDLARLRIGKHGAEDRGYYGPHLLINTTLNLIGGNDLATRDRKGESFLLSPLYCGSRLVGYSQLESPDLEEIVDPYLTLGRAISISGAAVDPNMSFYQSASLTALLTIFNARLGYWIETPKPSGWKAGSPKYSGLLLQELWGKTDDLGEYVHLSDGGHFENLGVYELIRRRCRYIILVDAEDDWDASDDNLANLIRLCRIDFGVRVKIDTSPLKATGPDRLSRSHVVIGQIHYDDVDRGEMPGVLIYVKASMTGDEAPDVQKYARKDERFPHQPTDLQQIFDEEQFECYRSLGDHIAREIFEDSAYRLREDLQREGLLVNVGGNPAKIAHNEYVPRLFSTVQNRWAEPPEDYAEQFDVSIRVWAAIRRDLGRFPELAELNCDLYPHLPRPAGGKPVTAADRERAELHTVSRMLQLMESSWMALKMKNSSSLPVNRGWMNTYRLWAGTKAFRRLWPVLRSEFTSDFARFCELQLNLTTAAPEAVRVGISAPRRPLVEADFQEHWPAIQLLAEEFEREWPMDHRNKRGVLDLVGKAADLKLEQLPVWVIYQAASDRERAGSSDSKFPCGIIIAANFDDFPAKDDPRFDPPESGKRVELFVWVRRSYRSIGLGSRCLTRELIKGLRGELEETREVPKSSKVAPLWARYPLPNPVDEDIEHRNWMVFFARYDFKPRFRKESLRSWDCSLLELE